MTEQLKSALGMKPSTAARFTQRDDRIKRAQTVVSQGNRELSRERSAIDRKEAKLLAEVRRHLLQGNTHSAHLVARQIATYRRLASRNLEASLAMDLKLHAMSSNNTVNRRQWETLKAIQHVDGGADDIKSVTKCAAKATRAMEAANAVEAIMNETMDDVYDFTGDEVEVVGAQRSVSVDGEVEEILRQAVDSAMPSVTVGHHWESASSSPTRSTASPRSASRSRSPSPSRRGELLFVKLASNPDVGASVAVDSLDVSVDMVKRALLQDPYAVHQLGLARVVGTARSKSGAVMRAASAVGPCWPFSLGFAVESDSKELEFEVLPIDRSLKSLGVQAGMVLFVQVHTQ